MKTALVLKKKSRAKADELTAKEEEIQLQLQLSVRVNCNYIVAMCIYLLGWIIVIIRNVL